MKNWTFPKRIRKCPIFHAKSSEEQKKSYHVRKYPVFHATASVEQKKGQHARNK